MRGFLFAFITFLLVYSCKPKCETHPDDPECTTEQELITTLRVIVADSATGSVIDTFQFKDIDGNGSPEIFDSIRLQSNSSYRISLQFLNEAANPAVNITTEIEYEANDHLINFEDIQTHLVVTYLDLDTHFPPLPVGLQTIWKTIDAETGAIRITLRHQPGIKDGTPAPGETDVSVDFPVIVQ